MDVPLIAGAYSGFSPNTNAQVCINLIPLYDKEANKWALFGRPGTKLVSEVYAGSHPVRGMVEMGGNLWIVLGDRIYKRTAAGVETNKGTLDTSTGPVSMVAGEGSKICFVDGTEGYVIESDTFAKITDADFPANPTHVCYIDGYYIVNEGGTGNFFICSTPDQPTVWGALDSSTAEGDPDNLQALYNNQNDLWLLGKESYEIWFDSGNATFPFERITGAIGHIGTNSPYSGAIYNRELFFLDNHGIVRKAKGLDPERISTSQVEYQIQQYTDVTDAIGYIVPFEGHVFYILNFQTDDETLVYDVTTGLWTNWVSGAINFIGVSYAYFNYQHIIGHHIQGKIYELDSTHYQDDAAAITWEIVTRQIDQDGKYLLHHNFHVDFEPGHSASTWALKWSDDAGHTWSTGSSVLMANADYDARAVWNRLGKAKHRIYKLTSISNAKIAMSGMAHADITVTDRR